MGLRRGSKGSRRFPKKIVSPARKKQKQLNAIRLARVTAQRASDARIAASKAAAVNASISDLKTANTSLQSNITRLNAVSLEGRSQIEINNINIARAEQNALQAAISQQIRVKQKEEARKKAIARQRAKQEAIKRKAAAKAEAARKAREKQLADKRAALLARPIDNSGSNELLRLAAQREKALNDNLATQKTQHKARIKQLREDQAAGKLTTGQARVRFNQLNQIFKKRTDPKQIARARNSIAKLRKQAAVEKRFEDNRNKLIAAEEDRLNAGVAPFQLPVGFVAGATVRKSTDRLDKRIRQLQLNQRTIGSASRSFEITKQINTLRIQRARRRFNTAKSFQETLKARAAAAKRTSQQQAVSIAIKQREQRATGQLVGTGTKVKVKAPKPAGRNFSIQLKETLSLGDSLATKFTPAPKIKAATPTVAPSAAAAGKIEVTRASGKKAIVSESTAKRLAERGDLSPESAATVLAPPVVPEIEGIIGPTKPTGKKPSQFTTTAPKEIQKAITKEAKPFIQEAFAEEGGSLVDAQTKQELQKNPEFQIELDKNKVKVVGGFKLGDEVEEVVLPTLSGDTFSAVAPTGRNINELQANENKKIGNALDAGLGVEVGGTFVGGETSVVVEPQAKVTTPEKPLVSPTRDGKQFFVKDGVVTEKPIVKSKATINAETVATRLGNAPFITQVELSSENLRQGSQLLDRSNFFKADGTPISADSLEGQVINRIGEEQDVKNVLNAIQEQRFQNIKNAQAEIDPITGQTIRTAGEVALDIARATPEPQVNFTFGAGSAFRPTGQEREIEQLEDGSFILTKTGGFTDENLPFIQEVLQETPRPSVQEGLGFGPPTVELETGKLVEKVNPDGSVEVVPETARFLDPDRFSSQFRPQVGVVSVGKPDVVVQSKSGRTFILSQENAQTLDKDGQLAAPLDNFTSGSKDELKAGGIEGVDDTFQSFQNLNSTPNTPFALPDNSGQVLESSAVTEDLARSGAVDFPAFIQTASADSGPAVGLIGPVPATPQEQVSIQKPLFDEKTLGLGEVRDKFSFGDFLENPIEGLAQFAGGATRSAQNEVAGIQNIGSLVTQGDIPQREFLGTPSQQFYEAVIEGGIEVVGQNFGKSAQALTELRQRGIGAVIEDPLGFIQSTQFVLNPIGSTIVGIAANPTVQQKFGELGQSILDNPFAAAGDIGFQAATFLGPQAVLKVARVAGIVAPKAATAAQLGVKLEKGQKIEAALVQSKKGAKKEVVNVVVNKGQKLKSVDNGLGGRHAVVVNKKTGGVIRIIESEVTPVAEKTTIIIDKSSSVNKKIAKTKDLRKAKTLQDKKQSLGTLDDLSKSELKLLEQGRKQTAALTTLDPTGTAQVLGKKGGFIKVAEEGGKRVNLKEKTLEIIDLKTGDKKIALRTDLAESITEMPLGNRLFDALTGGELAVTPSKVGKKFPTRAAESEAAGVLGKTAFEKGKGFEQTGVFTTSGTRIGPLPRSPEDIAAALAKERAAETNVFEDFLAKRGGFITREKSLGESAGAASFDPFFGRTISPTSEAATVAGRQFLPETIGLGTGSASTVVKVKPRLDTGSLTAKVFDTLSPAQKQAVIEEGFARSGIGTAKQSGKFADDVRTTALNAAAQGKSLRAILTEVNLKIPTGTSVATGRKISEKFSAIEEARFFVTDKTGFPLRKNVNTGISGRLQKGINQTLKARTKEFEVSIPTGTLSRDAQLTGDVVNTAAFAAALKKVKPSVLDDALGISPRRLVEDFGETRLSIGVAGEKKLIPNSFVKSAKSGIIKAVDDFAAPRIQRAATLGDDFLNIQKGVIGATSNTLRRVTSAGKKVGTKAKATPQKLIQKVKPQKQKFDPEDLNPDGTIRFKSPTSAKTLSKTADDLLEAGQRIKPKRGLPVGLITGITAQTVAQFRPQAQPQAQGFEQVLNPFESSKLGVQSSLALVPRQAAPPASRFGFPFATPERAVALDQPQPIIPRQQFLFPTPTPTRPQFGGPLFDFRGGSGDSGAGDQSARRKFFRVFDVARTPFGRVERGLGVQVQSGLRIQEISDVLGEAPDRNVSERFFETNGRRGKKGRVRTADEELAEGIFSF